MDSTTEDGNAAVAPAKKNGPFDNLSREDLIKKCKGLLTIAQKAKSARDGKMFVYLIRTCNYF